MAEGQLSGLLLVWPPPSSAHPLSGAACSQNGGTGNSAFPQSQICLVHDRLDYCCLQGNLHFILNLFLLVEDRFAMVYEELCV